MNNNKNDETALLAGGKGVFAKASYVSFGTKEKPEPYVHKDILRDSYKGKQFVTQPSKEGRTVDTFFTKKHLWVSEGDKYVDRWKYQETQPVKKKGFLTSDFSRRDEFSNTIRTCQYRQQLKMEDKFAKKALHLLSDATSDGRADTFRACAPQHQEQEEVFLYDLVYEQDNVDNSKCSRVSKDTKNPTILSKNRNLGTYRTSTSMAFSAPTEFQTPEYAHRPLIRDSFYRRTNVFFPDNCAAVASSDQ